MPLVPSGLRSAAVAPSTFFALVLHLNGLLALELQAPEDSESLASLVYSLAVSLEAVLDAERGLKPSVRKGAVKKTRRTLRTNSTALPAILRLLTAPAAGSSAPSATKLLPLLGLAIDVCLHLRAKGEETKGGPGGVGEGYVAEVKDAVLDCWKAGALNATGTQGAHIWVRSARGSASLNASTSVLTSCRFLLSFRQSSLRMFFQRFLDQAAFDALLAASEKTFVKSPETGFVALSATIPHIAWFSLGPYASTKLLTPILLHAKSPKAEVRAAAVAFFKALVAKLDQDLEAGVQAEAAILDEMLGLLKAGKTANADHRISLYSMIRLFPASPATAAKVVAILPAQIAKETTSEPALVSLLQTLSANLAVTLAANDAIPAAAMTALQKELASPKAATRRAVVVCVGDALWTLGEAPERWTEQADKFAEVAGKTLTDVSLKNVSANALTAAAGVGEGFVAAAVLLGPLSRSKSAVISA